MPRFASWSLMSSLCTTNYFSKHVSIIILCLLRGGRLYIAVLYNIFSSIFFLPVPEKKKFFEERNHLFSLIFHWTAFSRVCDITSVPHRFPLGTDLQLGAVRKKCIIAGNTYFSLSLTSFFYSFITIAYQKEKFL